MNKNITQTNAELESWTLTATGKRLDLLDPQPESICIQDIAVGLCRACRWNGQLHRWYSVAQHSYEVSTMVSPQNALAGLMHDASEAYFADIPRPMKRLIPAYKDLEDKLLQAVATKFGFAWPLAAEVHTADRLALAIEARDLFSPSRAYLLPDVDLDGVSPLRPLNQSKALIQFLARFNQLTLIKESN